MSNPTYSGVVRRPLVVHAHPGGRYPGIELSPTWFTPRPVDVTVQIPSAMPPAGDWPAIFAAVSEMGGALRDSALEAYHADQHPMLIGGDHSLAVGTLAAATREFGRVGVLWVDAHADFNTTETSPSGNPHGMPLAAACGLGDERLTGLFTRFVDPTDVVLIAAREIDPGERDLLQRHGVWVVTVSELRAVGVTKLIEAVCHRLAGIPVHFSFDFDSLDEAFFKATGTPSASGLTPEEAEAIARGAGNRLPVVSSDWVEFDPRHEDAPACELIAQRVQAAFFEGLESRAARLRDGGSQTASCA